MTFHPFHFIADVGVEVGVEFALELLFVTIHISVHLSADVHLEGPPFGGSAYVDFWVFGFTVPFGDTSRVPPKLSLADFETVLQQIPDADSAKNPGAGVHPLHVMSVESGRFTEKQNDTQTKQGDIWEVKRGGFVFRVQSRIPVQFVDQPDWPKDEGASTVAPEGSDFYGTPMQLSHQLTSQMHVQVTKLEDEPGVSPQPKDFHIRIQVIKQMPLSIWGKCELPSIQSADLILTVPHRQPRRWKWKEQFTRRSEPRQGYQGIDDGRIVHRPSVKTFG